MKIKKGDKVEVIKGKDRGKSGKVMRVVPSKGMIVVDGLNIRKKTVRPKKQGEKGQIVSIPWPMRVENAMVICGKCGEKTRIGHMRDGENKVRYCKKCKAKI